MSFGPHLSEAISKMSEEEVREGLTDVFMLLADTRRNPQETYDLLVGIYEKRVQSKYITD